jgi:hypothetical protein
MKSKTYNYIFEHLQVRKSFKNKDLQRDLQVVDELENPGIPQDLAVNAPPTPTSGACHPPP